MAQLEYTVEISRPLAEVLAFAADPVNDAKWGGTSVEVRQFSPGPIAMGCRYRYVARFLGRQFATVRELTEYEPNSRQSLTAESGPL